MKLLGVNVFRKGSEELTKQILLFYDVENNYQPLHTNSFSGIHTLMYIYNLHITYTVVSSIILFLMLDILTFLKSYPIKKHDLLEDLSCN